MQQTELSKMSIIEAEDYNVWRRELNPENSPNPVLTIKATTNT
jgi:hypothetical protein